MHTQCAIWNVSSTLHFIIDGQIKGEVSRSSSMKPNRPRECGSTLNFNILARKECKYCKETDNTDRIRIKYDSALNHPTWGNANSEPLKFSLVPSDDTALLSDCTCFLKHCGNSRSRSDESPGIINLGWLMFIFTFCIAGLGVVNMQNDAKTCNIVKTYAHFWRTELNKAKKWIKL